MRMMGRERIRDWKVENYFAALQQSIPIPGKWNIFLKKIPFNNPKIIAHKMFAE